VYGYWSWEIAVYEIALASSSRMLFLEPEVALAAMIVKLKG